MSSGKFLISIAAGASAFIGIGTDFLQKPSFGTVSRSIMDFTVLGKIPGTDYYFDYYGVAYAAISFVVVYTSLKLYAKGRRTINNQIVHPKPEHITM